MSFANAVPSKQSLSQLQAGQQPFASKNSPPGNVGGLEDFLNELNQATNLRLQAQEESASENRLKNNRAPESKESKTDSELQKLDANPQNPANIADSGGRSNLAITKIMAALEHLNQQNQGKSTSLLSHWGESALGTQDPQAANLDLGVLRTNLANLGLENILADLNKAQANGNLEQVADIQAKLVQKLVGQLSGLDGQNNDVKVNQFSAMGTIAAKTLQLLEAQKNQIEANRGINQALQANTLEHQGLKAPIIDSQKAPIIDSQKAPMGADMVRVLAVETSLAAELKMKQAANLDTEFTLAQQGLLRTPSADLASLSESTGRVEDFSALGASKNQLAGQFLDDLNLPKLGQKTDEVVLDDFGNLLSASQLAQTGTAPSAPTQLAMSLNQASIVSGPLHSEIMHAAKSGGGRIQLELTPPEQGTIRIDLRIDQSGRAHLIVEGANDAAKARLDQGGQQLKQEFTQMGLNLSLDLRQGDGRFSQGQQFGSDQPRFPQPSSSTDRSSSRIGLLSERLATTRFLSDNVSGVSGIHLYA